MMRHGVVLLALLAYANCDRGDRQSAASRSGDVVPAARDTGSPGVSRDTSDMTENPIAILVAAVAPQQDPESGIVSRILASNGPTGSHTRVGVPYGDGVALARALRARDGLDLSGDRLLLGGQATDIQAHSHDGTVYVAVIPFARRYGAYARYEPQSVTIYPRETLQYLQEHRANPSQVPILEEARRAGVWPPRS